MKKTLSTLVAISAACFGLVAHAQTSDAASAPALTKQEAKDAKTQSDAAYKARKDVADANHELNKGDCEVAADGSVERACKKDAKAVKKQEKAEAKVIHEAEKDAIKSNSK
ncbi:hypothetical protein [Ideonella sp. BN130291]|uniref:hypothetical protein n=1 Tax=Ideonella sp. BN130291 TaxID=3112940 RepID=UPI002E26FA84|nr:hypothetical protein [Ideonella sp. BN130291]